MELFRVLNKYRFSFSLQKSNLYKEVENHKQMIITEGFSYNNKDIDTLFLLEILYKGIKNKQVMDEAYNVFLTENQDIFNHVTYQERQSMLNQDINTVVNDLISFTSNDINIYIPYVEDFINQRYITDYQMILLKQHQDYINRYPRKLENVSALYGLLPYISEFSSLYFLGNDDSHYYFYFEENRTIYIFNMNYQIQDEFCIVDQYHIYNPSIDDVKILIRKILETKEDQEVIDYMHDNGYLSAKGYKKMNKKLG